jgi:exodeoxyribonuclease VII small subunit
MNNVTGKNQPTYAALQAELSELLIRLQNESIDIDDAITCYARGLELTQEIKAYLDTAEHTIKTLQANHPSL